MPPSPLSDKNWNAKWDLDTLVEAEEIKKDPARLSAAEGAVKTQQTDLNRVNKLVFGSDTKLDEAPEVEGGGGK